MNDSGTYVVRSRSGALISGGHPTLADALRVTMYYREGDDGPAAILKVEERPVLCADAETGVWETVLRGDNDAR